MESQKNDGDESRFGIGIAIHGSLAEIEQQLNCTGHRVPSLVR